MRYTHCAAGLAALGVYRDLGLFDRAASLSEPFLEMVFSLRNLDIVTDIRGYGMLAAVDIEPSETPGARGYELMRACYEAGMVLRIGGDTAVLAPALVADEEHLEEMVAILRKAISGL